MVFSLSFAGVQVSIITSSSSSSNNDNFCIKGVRHCEDGHIEADVCNFNGTIIISAAAAEESKSSSTSSSSTEEGNEQQITSTSRDMTIVNAIPEEISSSSSSSCQVIKWLGSNANGTATTTSNYKSNNGYDRKSSFLTANSHTSTDPSAYVPQQQQFAHENSEQLTVDIDSEDDDEEKKMQSPEHPSSNIDVGSRVSFDLANTQVIQQQQQQQQIKPNVDLTLHKACASDEIEIDELRMILKMKPQLASIQDAYGDYPAHIFANNDSFIYTSSDYDVQQFAYELYKSCPSAFLSEGYDGQLPFVGCIVDWVDDTHQVYERDNKKMVVRVSEIKTLTKSTRVINSLCVREEVQKLLHLPEQVNLPVKVIYSFKMLSFILDTLTQSAFEDISTRREFWAISSKRRDRIINSVASVPFIVRTILLIENKAERDALIDLSIVRNLMFRPQSVDLWLVALLSGGERARACATQYLCIISRSSLSGLVGRKMMWDSSDRNRFHSMRAELYREVGKLTGFLPCMLHLGDSLYEVSTRRAVKYVVESTIGKPLPVYVMFLEMFLLLLLMTSYRIIVELVYAIPSEDFLSQYRELWGLGLSVAVYFMARDLLVLASFSSTEEKLALKYMSGFGNMIGMVTVASVIAVLSKLYVNGNIEGFNYVGIVSGLLWWKFLLHVKGMSESLSTLIYTILMIASQLRYFLAVFLVSIFFFADMIDIVKKTSGDCDFADGEEMDSSLETFCSLTPLQSYLAMYGVMIGGMEISSLEGSSALVSLLFVAASFCGVIVLVNILIAIVTSQYEKATQLSCRLFARARLEAAARHVARDKFVNPPDDKTSGFGRKLWRRFGMLKYAAIVYTVEYFLIKSLVSCTHLNREGIIGDFLYVALILCAILYHIFLFGANMYLFARYICRMESLRWLRGSKFHRGMLKICLVPVCRYLSSVGLGKGEKCPDASDDWDSMKDHPVTHKEQLVSESNIQDAIKASETRILQAVQSMMFQQIPSESEYGKDE